MGTALGVSDGASVGTSVGASVGFSVGNSVGFSVGVSDGAKIKSILIYPSWFAKWLLHDVLVTL